MSSNINILKESINDVHMENLISAIKEGKSKYFSHGARSPKKIEPIHKAIAEIFDAEKTLTVKSKGIGDDKEEKVAGVFYDKDCDITIKNTENNKTSVVEVKFITTNYKQNANNYFENLLGATDNLRRNNINVSQVVILPKTIPYLKREGIVSKLEIINDRDISKYRKLMANTEYTSSPNNLLFLLIDMWAEVKIGDMLKNAVIHKESNVNMIDVMNSNFSEENIEFIKNHSNYNEFIQKVKNDVMA